MPPEHVMARDVLQQFARPDDVSLYATSYAHSYASPVEAASDRAVKAKPTPAPFQPTAKPLTAAAASNVHKLRALDEKKHSMQRVVFVDPQSKAILQAKADLEPVKMISQNTLLHPADKVTLVTAQQTLDLTLPKISSDARFVDTDTYQANRLKLTSVVPIVSHVVKTSPGDTFANGTTSCRIHGKQTKQFYGVNNVWYEA